MVLSLFSIFPPHRWSNSSPLRTFPPISQSLPPCSPCRLDSIASHPLWCPVNNPQRYSNELYKQSAVLSCGGKSVCSVYEGERFGVLFCDTGQTFRDSPVDQSRSRCWEGQHLASGYTYTESCACFICMFSSLGGISLRECPFPFSTLLQPACCKLTLRG